MLLLHFLLNDNSHHKLLHVYFQTKQGEDSLEMNWFCFLETAPGHGNGRSSLVCSEFALQEAKWGPPSPGLGTLGTQSPDPWNGRVHRASRLTCHSSGGP